jgi:hypothetical protein
MTCFYLFFTLFYMEFPLLQFVGGPQSALTIFSAVGGCFSNCQTDCGQEYQLTGMHVMDKYILIIAC